jgi:hypothetical protein
MSMNAKTINFMIWSWILGFSFLISLPLRAQVSGATLLGAVTDSSGGAVPNARVSAKNVATGLTSETTTNSSGTYSVPNLTPGDYQVSVSAQGFSTAISNVTLTVGAKQEMNLHLTVGQISQTVEVTGAALQVDLTTSTISGDVVGSEVRELPLNGRDWASLATLQPGVAAIGSQNSLATNGAGARGLGMQLTISGNRPTQNSYRLDGALMNDYSNAGPGSILGQNLGVDAIQEFSVLTSNYSAEYGFTSGGVINAITRSGTSQFHGSLYEFLRNDIFDARNYFDNFNGTPKSVLRQNQFGGSGGAPIFKKKVFVFADYEGVRRVQGISTQDITLSNAVLNNNGQGCPSGITAPCGTVSTGSGPVTVSIDPTIQKFLKFYPAPNAAGSNANVGLYNWQQVSHASENFGTLRADYKISDKDNFFATYLNDQSNLGFPQHLNDVLAGFLSTRTAIILEETHVFGPSLVNTARVAMSRTLNNSGQTPGYVNPSLASIDASLGMTPGRGAPSVNLGGTGVTGFSGGNHGAAEQDYTGQLFQVYDDAFITHGAHSIKFGVDYLRIQDNAYSPLPGDGSGTFSGRAFITSGGKTITGSAGTILDFLTNAPNRAGRSVDIPNLQKRYLRDNVAGAYIQDDWRFRPSLTLNLGLRYEMSTVPTEKYGRVSPLATLAAPAGAIIGNPPSLLNTTLARNPTLKNFEPRLGFAWDPFHNGKTAVRGGFGIFDALPLPYELILGIVSTAPLRPNFGTVGCGLPSGCIPVGAWPFDVPALASSALPQTRAWNYVDTNIKRNYVYQYNLNIQRTLTPSTTLTVGYTGSRGIHNPMQEDVANPVIGKLTPAGLVFPVPWTYCTGAGPGCAGAGGGIGAVLNPTVGPTQATFWQSRSFYNALEVSVDKKMSHGFLVGGAFTWSKGLDDSSGSFAGDNFSQDFGSSTFYNLALNKGPSDFNIGRKLIINALWDLPTPRSLTGFVGQAVKGWEVGTIFTVEDGAPFFPSVGSDGNDILGEQNPTIDPPNLIPGCAVINPGQVQYVNPNCFQLPQQSAVTIAAGCDTARAAAMVAAGVGAGEIASPGLATSCPNIRGTMARNSINFPGLINVDFTVHKDTHITRISETFDVQFRAEFFNILNHTNFQSIAIGGPTAGNLEVINSDGGIPSNFGRLQAANPGRVIQFALKLLW